MCEMTVLYDKVLGDGFFGSRCRGHRVKVKVTGSTNVTYKRN